MMKKMSNPPDRAVRPTPVPALADTAPTAQHDVGVLTSLSAYGLYLIDQMRAAEAPICCDAGGEYLHDYRVHLRRLRTLLEILPAGTGNRELATLARMLRRHAAQTNALRDLEVLANCRELAMSSLPRALRWALSSFIDHIDEKRQKEFALFGVRLSSGEYRKLVARVRNFLLRLPELPLPIDSAPVLGRRLTAERLRRVRRQGALLRRGYSAPVLHRLRIEFKRLRYGVDFFLPVLPESAATLAPTLKKLQDNLGIQNDCDVQSALLLKAIKNERTGRMAAAAIGGLMTRIFIRQQDAAREFTALYAEFEVAAQPLTAELDA